MLLFIILTRPHWFICDKWSSVIFFVIYFVSVTGAPVGIASTNFSLVFSLTTGIIKKLLSITRNKNSNKVFMSTKSKLDSIKTLISKALIDLEISYEEFQTIVNEKENYEKMKESVRIMKSSDALNEKNWKQ